MRKKKYSKLVGVLLTDETHELLVKVTDETEKKLTKYVREIIENKISKIEKEKEKHNENRQKK